MIVIQPNTSEYKPFPCFKNMSEREKFLKNYKEWPVLCKNELTEEIFYYYLLPDDSMILVRSYPYTIHNLLGKKEMTGDVYYLIKHGNDGHLEDCRSNMTDLKNHLTKLRKNDHS